MKQEEIKLVEKVGGYYTFWGVYTHFREKIVKECGWAPDTVRKYESSYMKIICRHLANHNQTPIHAYTRADYDKAVRRIAKTGYEKEKGIIRDYEDSTLGGFKSLMRTVVKVGAEFSLCENVFTETPTSVTRKGKGSKEVRMLPPRAMSIDIERRVGEVLLTDPMQEGEFMGLAGMFCWGARNAESCALNFGDIKLWRGIPGCWVAWVYKTTMIDSNAMQSSGKTRNADRVILLPSLYVKRVLERRAKLKTILGDDVDLDRLPVACRGDNYYERCSADDLTAAAHRLFERVGITHEQIQQAYEEMLRVELEQDDPIYRINNDFLDCSSPTAYCLRREYGTSLACVGLTEQRVAFQIGHDMGGPRETRNEFLNTKMLLEMKEMIDRRAIVNIVPEVKHPIWLDVNQMWERFPSGEMEFLVPEKTEQVYLQLQAREPMDDIEISLQMASERQQAIAQWVSYARSPGMYPKELDIAADYEQVYRMYV